MVSDRPVPSVLSMNVNCRRAQSAEAMKRNERLYAKMLKFAWFLATILFEKLVFGGFEMADILTEKLKSFKSFRVDAYYEGYPDVIFEIILDAVPTREQTEIAVKALEKFVYTYNIFHFLRPIHYISDIDSLPEQVHPRGIYIHIDFGGCCPFAMVKAVAVLEKTNLPIFRVALL